MLKKEILDLVNLIIEDFKKRYIVPTSIYDGLKLDIEEHFWEHDGYEYSFVPYFLETTIKVNVDNSVSLENYNCTTSRLDATKYVDGVAREIYDCTRNYLLATRDVIFPDLERYENQTKSTAKFSIEDKKLTLRFLEDFSEKTLLAIFHDDFELPESEYEEEFKKFLSRYSKTSRTEEDILKLTKKIIRGLKIQHKVPFKYFDDAEVNVVLPDDSKLSFEIWMGDDDSVNLVNLEVDFKFASLKDFERELTLELYRQLQKHKEIVGGNYCYLSNYETDIAETTNHYYTDFNIVLPKNENDKGFLEVLIDDSVNKHLLATILEDEIQIRLEEYTESTSNILETIRADFWDLRR